MNKLSEQLLEWALQARSDDRISPHALEEIRDFVSKLAQLEQLEAKNELWKQRVTFAEAKRIAERAEPDYSLAAYMLRDLPLTIEADLSSLAHSMHAETASDGDWVGLRDLWDKAFREALKKAGEESVE